MWLFLPFGFYSIVQKPGTDCLTVRVRVIADLDRLRSRMPTLSPTIIGGGTDYPARATIAHADFAAGLSSLALSINYSNFKGHVGRVLGAARAAVAGRVWGVLQVMETENHKYECPR